MHLQFIIDRIKARLAGWKRNLIHIAGWRVLVRCVLSTMPTFTITVLRVPKKILKEIDKCRGCFLWKQDEEISGASCKVSWAAVCTPTENGGLGIPDLSRFGRALRLRWPWLAWRHPDRPWVGSDLPCNAADLSLFTTTTSISIGDGASASFWHSHWMGPVTLAQQFPRLALHARRKNMTVKDALVDDT